MVMSLMHYIKCAPFEVYNLFVSAFEYIPKAPFHQIGGSKLFWQFLTSVPCYSLVEINESSRHVHDMPIQYCSKNNNKSKTFSGFIFVFISHSLSIINIQFLPSFLHIFLVHNVKLLLLGAFGYMSME